MDIVIKHKDLNNDPQLLIQHEGTGGVFIDRNNMSQPLVFQGGREKYMPIVNKINYRPALHIAHFFDKSKEIDMMFRWHFNLYVPGNLVLCEINDQWLVGRVAIRSKSSPLKCWVHIDSCRDEYNIYVHQWKDRVVTLRSWLPLTDMLGERLFMVDKVTDDYITLIEFDKHGNKTFDIHMGCA